MGAFELGEAAAHVALDLEERRQTDSPYKIRMPKQGHQAI